jgi:predicted ATP-grasp superfamily ATP-dependent carboligase
VNPVSSIRAAILAVQPSIIVPCDDDTVWHLHDLHARAPELRELIEHSLGASRAYPIIRSRVQVLQAAAALNIRVPFTRAVTSEADLKSGYVNAPAVLKYDGTSGGLGVTIARTQAEMLAELRRRSRTERAIVKRTRWLINHYSSPGPQLSAGGTTTGLAIQAFIPGRPANAMFACRQGEILASITVEVLASQGATGAAIIIRIIQNEEIERAGRLLASEFMLNGFFGLDFILEKDTGLAYLLELNPRATQLGHLCLSTQGDLVGALSARLGHHTTARPSARVQEQIIALFPQTAVWDPGSPYLDSAYHDVPWDQPELCRELLRDSWPDRHLLRRLYRYFGLPRKKKLVNWT